MWKHSVDYRTLQKKKELFILRNVIWFEGFFCCQVFQSTALLDQKSSQTTKMDLVGQGQNDIFAITWLAQKKHRRKF